MSDSSSESSSAPLNNEERRCLVLQDLDEREDARLPHRVIPKIARRLVKLERQQMDVQMMCGFMSEKVRHYSITGFALSLVALVIAMASFVTMIIVTR